MSVIRERVPAGEADVRHSHCTVRQFFYILQGKVVLHAGEGIQIAPQIKHQFKNRSDSDVKFLVVSFPSTRGDRVNQ